MGKRLTYCLVGLALTLGVLWYVVPSYAGRLAGFEGAGGATTQELDLGHVDVASESASAQFSSRIAMASTSEVVSLRFGRAIDHQGHTIPGVQVERRSKSKVLEKFETDAEGMFRFGEANPADRFYVADEGYVTLHAGGVKNGAVRVIAAPERTVTGVVLAKDSGLPIADALVTLDSGTEWARHLESVKEWSGFLRRDTRTDEAGRFEFSGSPDMSGGLIKVAKTGFYLLMPTTVAVGPQRLQLVLTSSGSLRTMRGIVLDANESPVEGARMSFDKKELVTSDASGEFEITAKSSLTMLTVVARGKGLQRFEVKNAAEYMVIHLQGDAVRMEGIVMDTQGQPIAEALIDINGRSMLGHEKSSIEGAMPMGMYFFDAVLVEDVLNGWDGPLRSDSNGRFSFLSGGVDSYLVTVIDKTTLATTSGKISENGANRFVLDRAAAIAIRGRVIDTDGRAMSGLQVHAYVTVPSYHDQTEDRFTSEQTVVVITDDAGEFSLSLSISTAPIRVSVWGDDIASVQRAIEPGVRDIIVTVARRCDVRLHWGGFKPWTQVSAHLADGQSVGITYSAENMAVSAPLIHVYGDVSSILVIPRNVAFWRVRSPDGTAQEFRFQPGPTGTVTDVHF